MIRLSITQKKNMLSSTGAITWHAHTPPVPVDGAVWVGAAERRSGCVGATGCTTAWVRDCAAPQLRVDACGCVGVAVIMTYSRVWPRVGGADHDEWLRGCAAAGGCAAACGCVAAPLLVAAWLRGCAAACGCVAAWLLVAAWLRVAAWLLVAAWLRGCLWLRGCAAACGCGAHHHEDQLEGWERREGPLEPRSKAVQSAVQWQDDDDCRKNLRGVWRCVTVRCVAVRCGAAWCDRTTSGDAARPMGHRSICQGGGSRGAPPRETPWPPRTFSADEKNPQMSIWASHGFHEGGLPYLRRRGAGARATRTRRVGSAATRVVRTRRGARAHLGRTRYMLAAGSPGRWLRRRARGGSEQRRTRRSVAG